MVTSDRPVVSALWLRWFGSRPHLVGAAVALLLVVAALLGVLETLLRPHFGVWWLVVIAGYVVGWWLTSIAMWLPGRVRKNVPRRSWGSTVLPVLDSSATARNSVVRERKVEFTIGMVVFVTGASFLSLLLLSAEQAEAVGAIMSGLATLIGALLVWFSNTRNNP
ncbi:hypothetical protein ACQPZX_27445 [Actinoplanes sp. CA-142083]|uniref:hypothetical protein n=1 Tax=Actinoplanes sp. CA-142083 TaxID=3239903 RepID=UPI003D90E146